MENNTEKEWQNLIEVSVVLPDSKYTAPMIRRLFINKENGGCHTMPSMAMRGETMDIAAQINHEYKRNIEFIKDNHDR